MDTELPYTCGLILQPTHVAKGLMQPLPIIEHLDELKHLCLSFLPRDAHAETVSVPHRTRRCCIA